MEIKKKEKNTVFFDLVLKREDINNAETEVYKKNKKHFQLPGFRKGHVPRKMIENMYGKDVFFEDAINELLPAEYEKAIKELDLKVVDQPNIDIDEESIKDDKDVVVKVSVDVKPEVELKDYEGIEIEDPTLEVTDELIDSEVENERAMNARIINVDDRAVEDGDTVNIDFKGSVDGEYFEGGEAESQDLKIGSNTFIPGFEEQLIGHNIDEEFDITVKFPEDYHQKDLAGKDAKFEIKLNSISYEELPELDDEFVKDISEFDTLEEFKADIRKKKEEEFKTTSEMEKQRRAIDKIGEMVDVEIPEAMINAQIDDMIRNYDQSLRAQGISFEDYIKMIGQSLDDFKNTMRPEAERTVKNDLALEALVKDLAIEITDEEIEEEVNRVVEEYFKDDKEHMEKMRDYMLNQNKEVVRDDLEKRKAIDTLVEKAKFVEPKETTEEEIKEEVKKDKEDKEEDK
ncbi:MAG: trigger factor [Peptoniphilus grossensis]|uniref:trigger factor n=1 Tax=Peptoniphilus grossensis TaxID=1465756 RepID=UPI00290B844D|nr:trigger factor [Peptoniphilus grossensis]MDU7151945.1 trigger factor [Peptoniphilus grossensis]